MSANIGILLPQKRAISHKILVVGIVAALMAAAALATVLALRSNGSADVARSGASQVQAVPNYQSWLQAQETTTLPAIVRFRAQGAAGDESTLSRSSAHLREVAGRRNFSSGSASTSSTSSDSELCPFGRRGPC